MLKTKKPRANVRDFLWNQYGCKKMWNDESCFNKATNDFNEQYKISEQPNKDLNSLDDDELDRQLAELMREKEERRRKRNKDFEL